MGEIEEFSVSAPERTSRFGPQPNIVRTAKRYRGQTGSVIGRKVNKKSQSRRSAPPPPLAQAQVSCWDGSVVSSAAACPSQPVAIFSDIDHLAPAPIPEPSRYRESTPSGGGALDQPGQTTNALSMSLLSGPQTISVTATLHYSYETPLDGKAIVETVDTVSYTHLTLPTIYSV